MCMLVLRSQIPNFLTLCNLSCGVLGSVYALEHIDDTFWQSAYFVFLAAVFDFLDGFVARLLKVSSPIGAQLDSLSDLLSFGLLPGLMIYALLSNILPSHLFYLQYFFLLIPIFSSIRLAKFNMDQRQTTHFIGLPTPANALFWSGIALMYGAMARAMEVFIPFYFVLLGLLIFAYLMVAEIEMFAFKFKGFGWKKNRVQYLFIISTVLLFFTMYQTIHWVAALPVIIFLYISFSVILNWTNTFNIH